MENTSQTLICERAMLVNSFCTFGILRGWRTNDYNKSFTTNHLHTSSSTYFEYFQLESSECLTGFSYGPISLPSKVYLTLPHLKLRNNYWRKLSFLHSVQQATPTEIKKYTTNSETHTGDFTSKQACIWYPGL